MLAAGRWSTGRALPKAEALICGLIDRQTPGSLLLACEALADIRSEQKLPLLRAQAIEDFKALPFQDPPVFRPNVRNDAATLLDRLRADDHPALDLHRPEYWADRIPPGPFMMGDDTSDQKDEKPAFHFIIRQAYALARFPVTNQQYLTFLKDLKQHGKTDEAQQRRPRGWPGNRYRSGEGNHPVVSISWLDATAFAAWADRILHAKGVLKTGEQVRLPTEPEWERAAAYPLTIPANMPAAGRRDYPWGGWDEQGITPQTGGDDLLASLLGATLTPTTDGGINGAIQANTSESEIGGTSVAGIFLQGAAACGAQDMAGNVWEWCSTKYQPYPLRALKITSEMLDSYKNQAQYVLRGGSWFNSRSIARCAYRNFYDPLNATGSFGFRLARAFSSSSS